MVELIRRILRIVRKMERRPEPGTREEEVLVRYSTASLRKNELSRRAKQDHLASNYRVTGADADKILDELYGPDQRKASPPVTTWD